SFPPLRASQLCRRRTAHNTRPDTAPFYRLRLALRAEVLRDDAFRDDDFRTVVPRPDDLLVDLRAVDLRPDDLREADVLPVLRELLVRLVLRLRVAALLRPPLRDALRLGRRPRPLPDFLPPPSSLLTVAHARRSASSSDTPRSL
ncbi:MAG TPA: hypothetical protein VK864_18215, partial [Longimicrobiales bacterium]|nr:hypothetical protein [Longimicrobiales bacterium]